MKPTRKSQPYRKSSGTLAGTRKPGSVLDAMLKGSPAHLPNPMDAQRKLAAKKVLGKSMDPGIYGPRRGKKLPTRPSIRNAQKKRWI